jgi:competence protein ComEC
MKDSITKSSGFIRVLRWTVAPLLVAAILLTYTAATMPGDILRVSLLDVGQGDAILIQKGNQQILVDGGPSPQAVTLELSRQMPFWDRSIDLVVLTHPHGDHLAGLLEVLRRYDVEQALYPSIDYDSSLYDEWFRCVRETGVKNAVAYAGQRIDLGDGISLEILWPPENFTCDEDTGIDSGSVVLLLKCGKISFLLTGDATSEVEWELIRERAVIGTTVIKVAHHGSITSTIAQFLSVVNPQMAVISVGENNTYNLPSNEVIPRLEEKVGEGNLYRMDRDGTVTFITDGERLWVEVRK